MKPVGWASLLGLAVVVVFLLSIRLGSVDLTTAEVFAALLGNGVDGHRHPSRAVPGLS